MFPLAYWMTETFHVDCVRSAPTKFSCVVESTKRGSTQLYVMDETLLTSARTDRDTHVDSQDHSVTYTYHLALVQPKTAIRSYGGSRSAIDKRVAEINAFLANPQQSSVRFTHDNRTMTLTFAVLIVLATALFTQDFSYKAKRST
jgi:type IV secretory pathway VirJ component